MADFLLSCKGLSNSETIDQVVHDTPSTKLIMNRFVLLSDNPIGCGSFSKVFRGYDVGTNKLVAIKTYNDFNIVKFRKEVDMLTMIHSAPVGTKRFLCIPQFLDRNHEPKSKDFIVCMEDFSSSVRGSPAEYDGCYYMILELASTTLAAEIDERRASCNPFPLHLLQTIAISMLNMLFCLHRRKLVHMDFKPGNIIFMSDGACKLIDLEGACFSGCSIDVDSSDIAITPLYCSPEFASQLVEMKEFLVVQEKMDIWAMGLTILSMISSSHPLQNVYDRSLDPTNFYKWLAESTSTIVPPSVCHFDRDLYHFLHCSLQRDHTRRQNVSQLKKHKFVLKTFQHKIDK